MYQYRQRVVIVGRGVEEPIRTIVTGRLSLPVSGVIEKESSLEVYTDGATVGWNGKLGTVTEIGIGVFIPRLNIRFSSKEAGISNNVAELRAMIRALELLKGRETESITLYADSTIAVHWFNKRRYSKKHPHLLSEQTRLYSLIHTFEKIKAVWIKREENGIADFLSNKKK